MVSERPGHAGIAMTLDVYSNVLPSIQQAAADRLEKLLFSESDTPKRKGSLVAAHKQLNLK